MQNKKLRVHSDEVAAATRAALERRGVTVEAVADIVYEMQKPYNPGLKIEHCIESVERVLLKREVQHAVLVGVELDELAEKKCYLSRCSRLWKAMKGYSVLMKQLHLARFSPMEVLPLQHSVIWISKNWCD